ncbi:hypothetical protein V5O48_014043 [Marasmius crinis-equi]|uniref:Carboxylic ester hydrolase n=1 Tax=Marasmius crinis-equi TaxID=585013 RepID=A0ABR3EYE0_9AGAR
MRAQSVFLILLPFAALSIASGGQRPEVMLGGTRVVGVRDEAANLEFFGGIPFAEPPLGALRLRPPVLKTALGSPEFDATSKDLAPAAVTEDCLTLNIFRPSNLSGEKLPVLFWIHGGSWIVGSGGRYNGSRLVSQSVARGTPVLFVAANYRLGPLGFPLGEEAASARVLNLGLKDHLAALLWVKMNIGAFGGDSSKVTIFGESAGARSIDLLLFNEQINDLASGAILESDGGIPILDPPLTNETWTDFVRAVVPCSDASSTSNTLECLRSGNVSSDDLLQALNTANIFFNSSTSWGPVIVDDELVPRYPSQFPVKAKFPIITGSCLDEGTLFEPQAPPNTSSDDTIRNMIKLISRRPPGREKEIQQIIDRVLKAYPNIPSLGSPFGTGNNTFGLDRGYKRASAVGKLIHAILLAPCSLTRPLSAAGDFLIQSHRRLMSNRLAQRAENTQVFSYLFADPNGGVVTVPPEFIIGSPAPGSLGVTHASEIFYVFGTLEDELGPRKVTTDALELSQTMMDYWISFAVSGDPNDGRGAVRPRWEPFSVDDPMVIQLKGRETRMIPDTFRERGIAVFNEDPTAFRR